MRVVSPHLFEVIDHDTLGVSGDEFQNPGQLGASTSSCPARLGGRGREEQSGKREQERET